MKKLVNRITNEVWYCQNTHDTLLIEGSEFIKVYRDQNAPFYSALMKKEVFTEMITNEQIHDSRNQLNG